MPRPRSSAPHGAQPTSAGCDAGPPRRTGIRRLMLALTDRLDSGLVVGRSRLLRLCSGDGRRADSPEGVTGCHLPPRRRPFLPCRLQSAAVRLFTNASPRGSSADPRRPWSPYGPCVGLAAGRYRTHYTESPDGP
ncbi:hypothetical protein SCOCK_610043 [Actinacidiphila cocklensis]|uniref:Uncharacterized protein n=1 Tax=Actinacidiphila cocklensis TaxID=887465 RepID=A0A9W4EB34_9ACTN|nr:hypothetical protein SCOCK_610043 [Actinacidiphila cocklensis]